MTALFTACHRRKPLGAVAVVDYFQQRERSWEEPVDRMLYGQLNEFGDGENRGIGRSSAAAGCFTQTGGPTTD